MGPVAAVAVRWAAAAPGQSVLDACCGAGASAVPLAKIAGTAGYVDAVDLSGQLTAYGADGTAERGLPQVSVHKGDTLRWADEHPGCTTGRLRAGVDVLRRPVDTLRRLAAAAGPEGRVIMPTWPKAR